jgi:hypothetical protein
LLAQSLCECIVLPGSSGKSDENDRASGPSKKIDLGAFRVLFGLGTKSIIWVQEHEIGAIQSGARLHLPCIPQETGTGPARDEIRSLPAKL